MEQAAEAAELRYPIGKFDRPSIVSREQRDQFIQQIADLPDELRRAVHGLSESQLDTPYRSAGWTVRQVVHHLADSHMNSYVRFKLALTEDEPTIKPYREDLWAELAEARTGPVEVSLSLLDSLHRRWELVLEAMEDAEFARAFRHPEMGLVPLDTNVALYAWHGRHHVAQVNSLRDRMGWR
ncbi:MAG: putative metal-dependent hydrolase [Bryobacteraceae bacterium]